MHITLAMTRAITEYGFISTLMLMREIAEERSQITGDLDKEAYWEHMSSELQKVIDQV